MLLLLLQQIIDEIIRAMQFSNPSRSYMYVYTCTGRESGVLYDSNRYTFVQLNEFLENAIQSVVPRGKILGNPPKRVRDVLRYRISIVGLKHKYTAGDEMEKVIGFMSFHNKRTGVGRGGVKEIAATFCDIVVEMCKLTNTVIVAGADLNCTNFKRNGPEIPEYEATYRRAMKSNVDFFILAWPDRRIVKLEVYTRIFPIDPIDKVIEDLLREKHTKRDGSEYSKEDYDLALDHDPLVCDFTVNVPI